jgi:hypothetical protein
MNQPATLTADDVKEIFTRDQLLDFARTHARKWQWLRRMAKARIKNGYPRDVVAMTLASAEAIDDWVGTSQRVVRTNRVWLDGYNAAAPERLSRREEQKITKRALWAAAAQRVAHGAAGILKVKLGIGLTQADTMEHREAICAVCPENKPCTANSVDRCCGPMLNVLRPGSATCGCVIKHKVRLANESCPKNYW